MRLTLREAADDGLLLDAVERGELDLAFVVFPFRTGRSKPSSCSATHTYSLVRSRLRAGRCRQKDPGPPAELDYP